jgi:hypothetical protein
MEEILTCKSGALTQDGGKYSDSRRTSSSTGRATRYLMLKVAMIVKVPQFKFSATTEAEHNNGKFFMLTKLRRIEPRV